ncbi:MAG: cupredoxin domain-containing protein [Actinomycetota bacterium]|nr:cupredoxin domain-containing protein [Actinomycetota bacterium]
MMRRWVGTVVGVALATLIGCGSASVPVDEMSTDGVSEHAVVVMEASAFSTSSLTLYAGKETAIEIVNNDSVPHDFVIRSLGVTTGTIAPGRRVLRTVAATKGTHQFVCTFHPGMKGRMEVV